MSQIYTEMNRLTEHGLVEAHTRSDGGRDVTSYAITETGQATLRTWLDSTPAGFPVLKHSVLLRLLMSNASDPDTVVRMLERYVAELASARQDLGQVPTMLVGSDGPGDAFRYPAMVAEWGLDFFDAETRHATKAIRTLPSP